MTLAVLQGVGAEVASAVTAMDDVRSAASASLPLFGDYSLADPAFLGLVPILFLLLAWGRGRRGRARGRMASLPARPLPRSWRQRLGWLPPVLQACALACAVVALSRPLRGNVQVTTTSEGVDIALVIDRSGSMRYPDMQQGKTRLDVVKEVVAEFSERRMTDREGAADSVGLFAYARFPELICPFTLDVLSLQGWIDTVQLVEAREEDGTAIGVALAKAVSVLRESDAKSRVVVLLTDGENNVNDITPMEAAELAAESNVRVYTIAAGRYRYVQDWTGNVRATEQILDTTELQKIAEMTGARFFRARDRDELEGIYAEIETLERTPRSEQRFEETFDLYPLFLLVALGLYSAAWISSSTWARRLA